MSVFEMSLLNSKPVRRSEIVVKDIGGETLLFNPRDQEVHVLNPTSYLIWKLCDGKHTGAEMVRALRQSYAVPEEYDVVADVEQTLLLLAEKNLFEVADQPDQRK